MTRPAPTVCPMTGEVSPAPGPPEIRPQSELRASHMDRDRVVEVLRVAAGDGRLTPDELDERLEAALTARTYSELAALTVDLPATGADPAGLVRPGAKGLAKIDVTSGTARRDGNWVVPQRLDVRVTSGHVKLDFTKAEIPHSALQLDVQVKSGTLRLVTRPGIVVDADDVAVRSGAVRVRTHRGPAVPVVLRIQVSGEVGSGTFAARPPRRTFWQWLLRRPVRY
jgi:Domain of unknown function (DUF1707)